MPGASTTPGRLGARVHAPIRVAFRIRNGVGTWDNNLCEAQWLACAFPYRRFAAALTDDRARLGADVVSYSFTVSNLHRLLVAGLPAHCERFWTLPDRTLPLTPPAGAGFPEPLARLGEVLQADRSRRRLEITEISRRGSMMHQTFLSAAARGAGVVNHSKAPTFFIDRRGRPGAPAPSSPTA